VNIIYDLASDSAYIQLVEEIGAGGVAFTYACDPTEVKGMIHLDFNDTGCLVGVEVMSASKKLPPSLLRAAIQPGG
jgi:uncharacterized protein YuzE